MSKNSSIVGFMGRLLDPDIVNIIINLPFSLFSSRIWQKLNEQSLVFDIFSNYRRENNLYIYIYSFILGWKEEVQILKWSSENYECDQDELLIES